MIIPRRIPLNMLRQLRPLPIPPPILLNTPQKRDRCRKSPIHAIPRPVLNLVWNRGVSFDLNTLLETNAPAVPKFTIAPNVTARLYPFPELIETQTMEMGMAR